MLAVVKGPVCAAAGKRRVCCSRSLLFHPLGLTKQGKAVLTFLNSELFR